MRKSKVIVQSKSAQEWVVYDKEVDLTYRITVDEIFPSESSHDQECVVYGTIEKVGQQEIRHSDGICAIRPDGSRVRIRFDGSIAWLESGFRSLRDKNPAILRGFPVAN